MISTTKVMYVGPTLEAIAPRNTVFEELPDALKRAISRRPYLSGLCVPISGLAKALRQIDNKDGGIYTLYARAEAEKKTIEKAEADEHFTEKGE